MNGLDLLAALPIPAYATDAEGWITHYNDAAAALWGERPVLGSARWCGAHRLLALDGRPLDQEQSPVALALRGGPLLRDTGMIIERADKTRVAVAVSPSLLCDAAGQVTGAVVVLVANPERDADEIRSARLAAIVASSDDAIISKTLDGIITSWNAGATKIFGYSADEMVGSSITKIIPYELLAEEREILSRLKSGQHIDHFETVRIAKDGRRVNISLTVSPLLDRNRQVVGASKVARDITDRKRGEELQRVLVDELNHRVKNTLAIVQSIATQSLRLKRDRPDDFVASFSGRIQAMGRSHDLLTRSKMQGADVMEIIEQQVLLGLGSAGTRVTCNGPYLALESQPAMNLSLVLHELSTNARRHGALSVPTGRIAITWVVRNEAERTLDMTWREMGGPKVTAPASPGFGTNLISRALSAHGGVAALTYASDGVICDIRLPVPVAIAPSLGATLGLGAAIAATAAPAKPLAGRRVLIVEDEPLVAMEIEFMVADAGCEVVGPCPGLDRAKRLIETERLDAALLDANLAGRPVDELAAALTQKGVPFAFVTGYTRDALPAPYRAAAFLMKPFSGEALRKTLIDLLRSEVAPAEVVQLRPHRKGPSA